MRARYPELIAALVVAALLSPTGPLRQARAAEPGEIPRGQSRMPGRALSPDEAVRAMVVPPGFRVEVVAAEPDLVNPVAMAFDDRGRVWVTESLEYPRRSPGPGLDRVKVMEDTDGDGRADRFTVFADGLNIPSGIAVGHGGVWVANAPDILFLQDTDGDGRADRREVVVTGFGRDDTHELPNSLTWGPDGWLYGWNGVFNQSVVKSGGKTFTFTCALFRIHPRTREFQLFAEGTSNPWGVTWDDQGAAFASACVIDHLWHITESGYYVRQGGPYPPHTWPIDSIVGHRHQQAAFCGVVYYDSDAYPAEYRGSLFMGNIHANGLNADRLRRNGSTYSANPRPDFLLAHDPWFMPVAQKVGPDGSLYVLDWYDRYHCYQDANRDPEGVDRLKGRLYRVRHGETPRRSGFDLAGESDDRLIDRLGSANQFDREQSRRLLAERAGPPALARLRALALQPTTPGSLRTNALWASLGAATPDDAFLLALLQDRDPLIRAWAVRAAGDVGRVGDALAETLMGMDGDPNPDVRLQLAVAAGKLKGVDSLRLLADLLATGREDPLLPRVVWQNLHPLLGAPGQADRYVGLNSVDRLARSAGLTNIAPRIAARLLSGPDPAVPAVARLAAELLRVKSEPGDEAAGRVFGAMAAKVQSGEVAGPVLNSCRETLEPLLTPILLGREHPSLRFDASLLAASWKDPRGVPPARVVLAARGHDSEDRLLALNALVSAGDPGLMTVVGRILGDPGDGDPELRRKIVAALGRVDDPRVPSLLLERYPKLEPDLQPRAVDVLTQRPAWGLALVRAVAAGVVAADALNANQLRNLQGGKDETLARLVRERWGTVRETRDPGREHQIAELREFLDETPGDPRAGALAFQKVCGQCHKIYGEGQEVGPEITRNGRASYDQLLSNVFDPSLVIGTGYRGTTVATTDGRILEGLLAEESPDRVVLKLAGGKLETIPRADIEALKPGVLSLMPEKIEHQLKPQELADLFAYITLDRPPTDREARPIPGAEGLPKVGARP